MADRGTHAAALAALPGAGSRRLARLLDSVDTVQAAWARVVSGDIGVEVAPRDVRDRWRSAAAQCDLEAVSRCLAQHDAYVTTTLQAEHPQRLTSDIDPAPVLFVQGRPVATEVRCVAVVGTRRSTPTGREVARELGAGLARAGVVVVSGLALGIDGAAHRGALTVDGAPPLAVVASGLDVIYPRRHRQLWEEIRVRGTLCTEGYLGCVPEAWRFPARNRLLAAFADLVVVVESRAGGGSMHTVEQAMRRDRQVMAVPGSVRNPAAVGTNLLLSEGCAPVTCVDDVLVAVGLSSMDPRPNDRPAKSAEARRELSVLERQICAAVDDVPVAVDSIMALVEGNPPQIAAAIEALVGLGLLARDGGRVLRGSRSGTDHVE